jgi:hypothetical protein
VITAQNNFAILPKGVSALADETYLDGEKSRKRVETIN